MFLASATFVEKLLFAFGSAITFLIFRIGPLILAFFLLSRLTAATRETWSSAKPKHPLRAALITFCIITVVIYTVGEIGISYTKKEFQKKYAYIDLPEDEVGDIEIHAYKAEITGYHVTDPEEREELLTALRQVEYVGWATDKVYGYGNCDYNVYVRPLEKNNADDFVCFHFAEESCINTDFFPYFCIALGNTESVITYMENLF